MINILPYKQKELIGRIRALRVVTATIWAVIFLIVTAGLLLIPLLVTTNSRFVIANNQIVQLERSGVVANPVDVAALEARAKIVVEKLAALQSVPPTEYISIIQKNTQSGITLSGFALDEKAKTSSFSVSGIARSREVLQQFVAMLGKDTAVLSVDSPVSNYVKSSNSQFTIVVTFK